MDPSKMMPKAAMMGNARPDMMWHGAPNAPQTHGAVSVVTTVYPGMPAFGAPHQTYNTGTNHPNGNNMFGTNHASTPSAYVGQPGPVTKTPSASSSYGPMDGGMYGPPHEVQHYQAYPSHGQVNDYAASTPRHAAAVNAAAQAAAAAAVATATATATAVAIDQSQFQTCPQPVQYANQAYQAQMGQMGMVAPQHQPDAYSQNPAMITQQRHSMSTPYVPVQGVQGGMRPTRGGPSNVPRYPNNPISRAPGSIGHVEPFNQQQQYGISGTPAPGMGPSNMAMLSQRPMAMQQQQQQQHPVGMYGPPQGNNAYQQQRFASNDIRGQHYQGGMPAANPGPVNAGYGQMAGPAPMQNNYGQANGALPNYQNRGNNAVYGGPVAALPNNPTPPLTPAATGGVLQGAIGFGVNDGQPPAASQGEDAEPRVTLPVKNGIILAPFRLEHNSPVSQHMFTLDERTYQMLMSNPNYDLQLKCFHAEDKAAANNWPHNANIQICVNGSPVIVKSVERPLYIKPLCKKQQNTLQVAVQQCCCSHLFCLNVVTRPSIESAIREVSRMRTVPMEQCVERIRSFFNSGDVAQMRSANGDGNPDIEQMSINMSLKCPITMKRIKIPVRGKECKHPQCFDLAAYLEINKDKVNWQCPICKRAAPMEFLEVDQFILQILMKVSNLDADEVTLDSTATWKPVVKPPGSQSGESSAGPSVKEEETDVPCGSAKRFKSEPGYSPASWNHPSSAPTPHFQSPGFNRSDSVLSPYYQSTNSPTPGPSFPSSVGTPGSAGPPFGSPTTQRQMAPKLSKSSGMPMTPQMGNPSSANMSTNILDTNSQIGIHPGSGGFGGPCSTQQVQNQVFSGSSYPGSGLDSNAAGGFQNTGASTSNTGFSDFPDFTFDDSDLLGSGDMTRVGGGLLNDPEEWMKYLTDPSDFNPFGVPANDQQRPQNSQDSGKFSANSNSANPATSNNAYRNSSYSSSELASMDDILALLRKN